MELLGPSIASCLFCCSGGRDLLRRGVPVNPRIFAGGLACGERLILGWPGDWSVLLRRARVTGDSAKVEGLGP